MRNLVKLTSILFMLVFVMSVLVGCTNEEVDTILQAIEPVLVPPLDLVIVGADPDQISLSWDNPPEQNPRFGSFYIYCALNTNSVSNFEHVGTTTLTSFTVTNLTSNIRYYFKVLSCATNGNLSEDSEIITAISGNHVPTSPENVSIGSVTTNSIMLSWDAATDLDGSITNYIVYLSSSEFGTYSIVGSTSVLSFTIESLQSGHPYFIKIRSVDNLGDMSSLSTLVKTNTVNRVPYSPSVVTLQGRTSSSISLSWVPAVDLDGSIASYTVHGSTTSGSGYSVLGSTGGTNLILSGLDSLQAYYFVIDAVDNLGGVSPLSLEFSASTRSLKPGAPVNVVTNAIATNSIVLSWDAAVDPDGTITNYSLYSSTVSGGPYVKVSDTTSTVFTFDNLLPGSRYYFVIKAVDNTGEISEYSVEKSVITIPIVPTGVTASDRSGTVAVSWVACPGATGYRVIRSTNVGGPYSVIADVSSLSFEDATVTKYVTNYYAVCAYNESGYSSVSIPDSGYRLQNYTSVGTFGSGLSTPSYLAFDKGNTALYVSEGNSHRMTKIDMNGNTVYAKTVYHTGGIDVDSNGIVYIGGGYLSYCGVKRFSSDGTELSMWSMEYFTPSSIFVDGNDSVFLTGERKNVFKYNVSGVCLTNWNNVQTSTAVATYGDNIYVADSNLGKLHKLTTNYEPVAVWDVIPLTWSIYYHEITALEVDSVGNLYVVSEGHIVKFSPDGKLLARFSAGATDVAISTNGRVYVSNTVDSYIRMYDPEP